MTPTPITKSEHPKSTGELLARIEAPPKAGHRIQNRSVLAWLRSARAYPYSTPELHRICQSVRRLDPTWELALEILARNAGTLPNAVGAQLVQEARQQLGFPLPPEAVEGSETSDVAGDDYEVQLRTWVEQSVADQSRLAPAVLMALWPERTKPHFQDLALVILEKWTRHDSSLRGNTEFARALFDVLGGDLEAKHLASSVLKLLAPFRSGADVFEAERRRFEQEIEDLTASIAPLRADLRRLAAEVETYRVKLAEAREEAEGLRHALERARLEAEDRERDLLQQHQNEIGRLRRRVLATLSREVEELRLYLEGSAPDAEGALARVEYLDRLRQELTDGE